ncbi:G-alpha-domain-containing protein [Phanerochaete sordida]|uniref:G-alpha-domain-containing protein n=1 Tax=Phanerochaete sordida TaxID=48140 RepID=A0A9P3G286_9APHY|nr:G-alpha-domain-containing protein [Phanerochaete sordida]
MGPDDLAQYVWSDKGNRPPFLPPSEDARENQMRAEAATRSHEIDRALAREARDKRRDKEHILKMLLLGQSGSGKTTVLKNIRMMGDNEKWEAERGLWRPVVYYNLLHSVNAVVQALGSAIVHPAETVSAGRGAPASFSPTSSWDSTTGRHSTDSRASSERPPPPALTMQHGKLRLELAPLRQVEADLEALLTTQAVDDSWDPGDAVLVATPFVDVPVENICGPREKPKELTARSHEEWMGTVAPLLRAAQTGASNVVTVAANVLWHQHKDITQLWQDRAVQDTIRRRRVILDSSGVYFLNHAGRIAQRNYVPTDDDILHARLHTISVQEYNIDLPDPQATQNSDSVQPHFAKLRGKFGVEQWRIFDVGGSRTQRAHWLPFFDDVKFVLFVAPIHCFDEHLAEDHRVNRLADSIQLWTALVKSALLKRTDFILFLNKVDLLRQKLAAGSDPARHVPQYTGGLDPDKFTSYVKRSFSQIYKQSPLSRPENRTLYIRTTAAVDPQHTQATLVSIEDAIQSRNVEKSLGLSSLQ